MRRPVVLALVLAAVLGLVMAWRVAGTPPGTQAALRVARKDGEHMLHVKLGRLRDEPTSEDR